MITGSQRSKDQGSIEINKHMGCGVRRLMQSSLLHGGRPHPSPTPAAPHLLFLEQQQAAATQQKEPLLEAVSQ